MKDSLKCELFSIITDYFEVAEKSDANTVPHVAGTLLKLENEGLLNDK